MDISPTLIAAVDRFAAGEGVGRRVEFRVGDVHALDDSDASFDIVIAHTLVSHASEPSRVLAEAARVTKPGGFVAVFDGDYASWTFGYPDPAVARAMDEALIASVVNNPV